MGKRTKMVSLKGRQQAVGGNETSLSFSHLFLNLNFQREVIRWFEMFVSLGRALLSLLSPFVQRK